jgi:hypothetical protein
VTVGKKVQNVEKKIELKVAASTSDSFHVFLKKIPPKKSAKSQNSFSLKLADDQSNLSAISPQHWSYDFQMCSTDFFK